MKHYFLSIIVLFSTKASAECSYEDLIISFSDKSMEQFKYQMCEHYFYNLYNKSQITEKNCNDLVAPCRDTFNQNLFGYSEEVFLNLTRIQNSFSYISKPYSEAISLEKKYWQEFSDIDFFNSLHKAFNAKEINEIPKECRNKFINETTESCFDKEVYDNVISPNLRLANIQERLKLSKLINSKRSNSSDYQKEFIENLYNKDRFPSLYNNKSDYILESWRKQSSKQEINYDDLLINIFNQFASNGAKRANDLSLIGADPIIRKWIALNILKGKNIEQDLKPQLIEFLKQNKLNSQNINTKGMDVLKKLRLNMAKEVANELCNGESAKKQEALRMAGGACKILSDNKKDGKISYIGIKELKDLIKIGPQREIIFGDITEKKFETFYNMNDANIECSEKYNSFINNSLCRREDFDVGARKINQILSIAMDVKQNEIHENIVQSGAGEKIYGKNNWEEIQKTVRNKTSDSYLELNKGNLLINDNLFSKLNIPELGNISKSEDIKNANSQDSSKIRSKEISTSNISKTSGDSPITNTQNYQNFSEVQNNEMQNQFFAPSRNTTKNENDSNLTDRLKRLEESINANKPKHFAEESGTTLPSVSNNDTELKKLQSENAKLKEKLISSLAVQSEGIPPSEKYIPTVRDNLKSTSALSGKYSSDISGSSDFSEDLPKSYAQAKRSISSENSSLQSTNTSKLNRATNEKPHEDSKQNGKEITSKELNDLKLIKSLESIQDVLQLVSEPKEAELEKLVIKSQGEPFFISEKEQIIKVIPVLDDKGKITYKDNKILIKKEIINKIKNQNLHNNLLKNSKELKISPTRKKELDNLLKNLATQEGTKK